MLMPSVGDTRFAFYAKRYSRSKASIRLRLLEPIEALRETGVDARRYPRFGGADDFDAVIISKAFGRGARRVARKAEEAGCRLILDMCDNRFANPCGKDAASYTSGARDLLRRADIVTVPTNHMGRLLLSCVPDIAGKLRVVPDMLDVMDPNAARRPSLPDRLRLVRLRAFLGRHSGALHCVWFGNNMAGVSGLGELGRAIGQLRDFAARHPVTLTIISNRRDLYRFHSRDWPFPHIYMPWSLGSFPVALAMHRVAIVPVARNDYTAGKSINRPATAIMAGLGVVADAIESYEELRPYIALDDWQGGLARYAFGWGEEQDRLSAARAHLDRRYGRRRIAERWRDILHETVNPL